jgi:hypothetical protein
MSSKATLVVTPVYKDDGSEYTLYLSLEVSPGDNGVVGNWWLPQQFGWARTDTGTFAYDPSDSTTLLLTDGNGNEGMQVRGTRGGSGNDLPFVPDDRANRTSGTLVVEVDNTYLKVGNYTWTVDYCI